MSILDSGPHTVTVIPKVKVANDYGGWDLGDGTPVLVPGVSVQPVSTEEKHALGGSQVDTVRRIIGRGPWPGGMRSTVLFEKNPDGTDRKWDQRGEAEFYTTGRRTKHFNATIWARSAEVK